MPSENAKAVAQEVIETVRSGQKVNFQKIQKKHGYSEKSAKAMKAKKTVEYEQTMEPVIQAMIDARERAIKLLAKTENKAKYRDLMDGLDKLTKNIQLLSGGKTSNDEMRISWDK